MGILLNKPYLIKAYQTGKNINNNTTYINSVLPQSKLKYDNKDEDGNLKVPFADGDGKLFRSYPDYSEGAKKIVTNADADVEKIKGKIDNVTEGLHDFAVNATLYAGTPLAAQSIAELTAYLGTTKLGTGATDFATAAIKRKYGKEKVVFDENTFKNLDSHKVSGLENFEYRLIHAVVRSKIANEQDIDVEKITNIVKNTVAEHAIASHNDDGTVKDFNDLAEVKDGKSPFLDAIIHDISSKEDVDLSDLNVENLRKAYHESGIAVNTSGGTFIIPIDEITSSAKKITIQGKDGKNKIGYAANLGDVLGKYSSNISYTDILENKGTMESLSDKEYDTFSQANLYQYLYNHWDTPRVLGEAALTLGTASSLIPTPATRIAAIGLSLLGTIGVAYDDFSDSRISSGTAWRDLGSNLAMTALNTVASGATEGIVKVPTWLKSLKVIQGIRESKAAKGVGLITGSKLTKAGLALGAGTFAGFKAYDLVEGDNTINNKIDLTNKFRDIRDIINLFSMSYNLGKNVVVNMSNVGKDVSAGVNEGEKAVKEANTTKKSLKVANSKRQTKAAFLRFTMSDMNEFAGDQYDNSTEHQPYFASSDSGKKLIFKYKEDPINNKEDFNDLLETMPNMQIFFSNNSAYLVSDKYKKGKTYIYYIQKIDLEKLGFNNIKDLLTHIAKKTKSKNDDGTDLIYLKNKKIYTRNNAGAIKTTYNSNIDLGRSFHIKNDTISTYGYINQKSIPITNSVFHYIYGSKTDSTLNKNVNAKEKGGIVAFQSGALSKDFFKDMDWGNLAVAAGANALSNVISYKKPEKIINDEYMQEINNPRLKATPLFYSYMPNMSLQPKKITEAEKNAYKGILINNMPETHTNSLTQNRNTDRANAMKLNDQMTKFKMNEISSVQQQETQKASQALKNLANTVATDNRNEQSIYQSKIADATNFKNFLQSYYQNKINFATLKNKDTVDSIQYMLDLFLNKGKEPVPSSYYKKGTTTGTK